jgi:hypothetical protein
MKKLLIFALILGIGGFFANAFGQENKTQDRKGGYAVGGYDNTRQEKDKVVTKRSVELPAESEPVEKAEEAEKAPAAPAAPAAVPPADQAKPQKEDQGNAYGKNKENLEGKESGQNQSENAKSKQKAKNEKSKGKHK